MKRIMVVWLVITMLIGGMVGFVNLSTDAESDNGDAELRYAVQSKSGLTSHDPISINGNADFASQASSEGWAGNGTETNPYIIENYDINASSADGIYVENTDVYFVVRNCVIHDGKGNYKCGIYFYNVTNGIIDNVTLYNNYNGIKLWGSSNNIITNCAVYNNSQIGIWLDSSSNSNQITNCNVYNNSDEGIFLYSSSNNNTISNCSVYNNSDDGIWLGYSSNNNITNCDVSNNSWEGIKLYSSSNNQITNCAVYNNTFDGVYLEDSSNNQISNCTAYNNHDDGICLFSSSNNQIINCSVYNNYDDGIYLCSCSYNNIITNCAVYNNFENGILLYYFVNSNQITNCTVYNNSEYGIHLYAYANNNIIINCTVYNNSGGIELCGASNNILQNNVLENNTYNFGVYGSDISRYYQEIEVSNTINGKPIYYIIEQNGLIFDDTMSIGYLGLVSCNNIVIENLTLIDNIQGLLLINTSDSTITNCTIYNNEDSIKLDYTSNNNNIANCVLYNNSRFGIYLSSSSNNNIISNCAVYNNSYGICLYSSSNNEIHYCNIYDNMNYGLCNYNTESHVVNATYNWWGSVEGPHHLTTNPNGAGDNVTDNVLYDPWLNSPWSEEDNTAPTSYVNTISPYWQTSTPFTITATASDNGGSGVANVSLYYRYSNDNSSWGAWTLFDVDTVASWEWIFTTPNGEGYYQFYSIATDNADNAEIAPETADVICGIDIALPTGSIVINEGNIWTNSTMVTLTLNYIDTLSGVSEVRYSNDGVWDTEEWGGTVGTKGWTLTTGDGVKTVYYQIKDNAGLISEFNDTIILDTKKPVINITGIADISYYNTDIIPTINITDIHLNITSLTLNNNPFTSGTTISAENTYTLVVQANDKAGNTAQRIVSFTVDKTKPVLEILSPANNTVTNQNIVLTYSVSDNMDDRGNITVNILNGTVYSDEKSYTVMVNATDRAGNTAIQIITFIVDKTKPTISDIIPATGTKTTKSSIVVSGKTEPDATVKINGVDVPVSSDGIFSKEITLVKGENTITVTATDLAGNIKTETIIITKTEKKQEKGFIPGFELLCLISALYLVLAFKRRRKI